MTALILTRCFIVYFFYQKSIAVDKSAAPLSGGSVARTPGKAKQKKSGSAGSGGSSSSKPLEIGSHLTKETVVVGDGTKTT